MEHPFGRPVLFGDVPHHLTLGIDSPVRLTGQGSGHPDHGNCRRRSHPTRARGPRGSYRRSLAFILPAICYLYIVYYGLRGSRHA